MSLLFLKSSSTTCVMMSICIISDIFVIDVTIKVNAAAAGHFLSDLFLIKFDFD